MRSYIQDLVECFKSVCESLRRYHSIMSLLSKVLRHLPDEYGMWERPVATSLALGLALIDSGCVVLGCYLLRYCLEAVIQLHYFTWLASRRGIPIRELLAKYSRFGRAFWLKMIRDVPGLPGVYRKQLARVYIELAHYTHPSTESLALLSRTGPVPARISDVARDVVDFVMYFLLHHVDEGSLRDLDPEEFSSLGLTRAAKYVAKRLRKTSH
ncbi:MAG: hypothetical protein DRJ40_08890 [Thermoprotei archaeon]|nr:MAG: hypothetical protein DRJ40_08890 [Thermoprotei archaeon]